MCRPISGSARTAVGSSSPGGATSCSPHLPSPVHPLADRQAVTARLDDGSRVSRPHARPASPSPSPAAHRSSSPSA